MAKFKIGDLVKVDMSKRSDNLWWDDIDEKKVYKVRIAKVNVNNYFLEGLPYCFGADWLMPAFKFEIGENVKVGDAIGYITEQYKTDSENCYLVRFTVFCIVIHGKPPITASSKLSLNKSSGL